MPVPRKALPECRSSEFSQNLGIIFEKTTWQKDKPMSDSDRLRTGV